MGPDRQVAGGRQLCCDRILGGVLHQAGHQALGDVVAEALFERGMASHDDRAVHRLGIRESEDPVARHELGNEADIHGQVAADGPEN